MSLLVAIGCGCAFLAGVGVGEAEARSPAVGPRTTLVLTPDSYPCCVSFTVSGSGYKPGTVVDLTIETPCSSYPVHPVVGVDENGQIIPTRFSAAESGTYTVIASRFIARGQRLLEEASAELEVTGPLATCP